MGIRFRKSINLGGGFRVNLSKSGIGYSWGMKGFHVSKTARGTTRTTMSLPGTGLSYVQESGKKKNGTSSNGQSNDLNPDYYDVKKIESADIDSLQSEAYSELFSSVRTVKIIVYTIIILAFLLAVCLQNPAFLLIWIIAAVLPIFIRPTITYDFDEGEMTKWMEISEAWEAVACSNDLRQILQTAKNKVKRQNAGIENSITTKKMKASQKLPWYVKTNIEPIVFKMDKFRIAIMPDRLLIFDKKMGAVDYEEIIFKIYKFGFLVTTVPPKDSEIIEYRWKVANNDGSRDKRVKNNVQYPLMQYARVYISSESGLNIQFICSNEKAAFNLKSVLKKYSLL